MLLARGDEVIEKLPQCPLMTQGVSFCFAPGSDF